MAVAPNPVYEQQLDSKASGYQFGDPREYRSLPGRMGRDIGTQIPHQVGGVPAGLNVHDVAGLEFQIDPPNGPTLTGNMFQDPVRMAQAMKVAEQEVPQIRDIKDQRARIAATMRALMTMPATSPTDIPPSKTAAVHQGVTGLTQMPHRTHSSPAGLLNAVQPATAPVAQVQLTPAPAPVLQIGPPEVSVTVEIEGLGEFTVNYHDVLVCPGFIVLVLDMRFPGAMKWFPPVPRADQPTLAQALQIQGHPEVYRVHPTGITYEYEHRTHCVVLFDQQGVQTAVQPEPATAEA